MHPFGRAEIFRFRHMLVALVEELKLLKRCDADSAAKIQDLVNKNHFLQRSKESEQQKARLKEEALERAMRELRQQYEDKLKRHETDQQQQRVIRNECNEFIESKIMDEMRQLQITVYHQEKTIKELEAKVQSQEHSADKTLTQWVTVESKMTSLHETYQITLESVDRLDKNEWTPHSTSDL